jgi:COMPASS component BRE2
MSMPEKFFPPEESVCRGDVLGFELQLPSLALHRKVVEGTYNKAVDNPDGSDPPSTDTVNTHTLLRDRYPIRYKNELYHEHYDYQPSRELEDRFQPPAYGAPSSAAASQPPNPNHPTPALRTLPASYLKVFKNGKQMGTAFKDLLAFLPPASRPGSGVREGLDDSTLGYYPSVGVFSGGAVEANFGPKFAFPPPETAGDDDTVMAGNSTPNVPSAHASLRKVRPVCERYDEQIAEDIVFDVIDEVDCWLQDSGVLAENRTVEGVAGSVGPSSARGATPADGAIASDAPGVGPGPGPAGEGPAEAIKELVQDEE